MPTTFKPLAFTRLLSAVVLFVGVLGSADQCHASCGDYLSHHGTPQLANDSSLPRETPAPCQGLSCSRRPEAPPAPTRPTVETNLAEWLCVLEQIRDPNEESSRWLLEFERVLARRMSHRLKRPPRSV